MHPVGGPRLPSSVGDRLAAGQSALYAWPMADRNDVRRIALSLPGTTATRGGLAFSVRRGDKEKSFVWVWLERLAPKKARVPNAEVFAVRVANLFEKDMLIASNPKKLFTEPHYDGFPAVLVRLPAVSVAELRELITSAWRSQAPRALVEAAENRRTRPRNQRKKRK